MRCAIWCYGSHSHAVKPEATDAEIDEVVQRSDNGQQIFADAVLHSSYGEARNAYREVEARQQDLARMEQTIAELAALFSDVRFSAHIRISELTLA